MRIAYYKVSSVSPKRRVINSLPCGKGLWRPRIEASTTPTISAVPSTRAGHRKTFILTWLPEWTKPTI